MNRIARGCAAFFILVALSPSACSKEDANRTADLVFVNGAVYTMDPNKMWASAVAVSGDVLVYVGDDDGARSLIGRDTRVLDLDGMMLAPGFIDAHNHPVSGGVTKIGLELTGARSKEEILERLQLYVEANPGDARYFGFGWEISMFGGSLPTKGDLDAIVAERPVLLLNEDSHHAWANSVALRNAGIDSETKDEVPGSIYHSRDDSGEPIGLMFEPPTWYSVAAASGFFGGIDSVVSSAEIFIGYLSRHGVTTVQDMGMWVPGDPEPAAAYDYVADLERQGELPIRFRSAFAKRTVDVSDLELERFLRLTREYQDRYNSDRLKINGFKVWMDGVSVAETASMLAPYESGKSPESLWSREVTERWLEAFHLAGINFNFHCEGDGAVRTALDAIESVQEKHGRRGRRHVIHHASLIDPADISRFVQLGVTLSTTPIWFTNWKNPHYEQEVLLPLFGEERARERWGIQRIAMDTGAVVTFGADVPGSDLYEQSPLYMIEAAVTRKSPLLENDPGLKPRTNAFTLEKALQAYTVNSAYQIGMEDQIGSVEVGKIADLIVIESNLFDMAPEELHLARVLLTLSGGKVVHDAHFGIGDVEAGRSKLAEDFQRIARAKEWINQAGVVQ